METTKLNKNHSEAKAIANKQIRYREALTSYGIIPFLMTLQRFETEERYKECQLMTDTIKRLNLILKTYQFPTEIAQVTPELLKDIKKRIGINDFESTIEAYANECYNSLLQIEPCSLLYKSELFNCKPL